MSFAQAPNIWTFCALQDNFLSYLNGRLSNIKQCLRSTFDRICCRRTQLKTVGIQWYIQLLYVRSTISETARCRSHCSIRSWTHRFLSVCFARRAAGFSLQSKPWITSVPSDLSFWSWRHALAMSGRSTSFWSSPRNPPRIWNLSFQPK